MLSCTTLLLAASMAVGQAEDEAKKPEYNPLLEPIAYMVGDWEMEKKSLLGELRATRRVSAKWSADGQLLLLDLQETNADGTGGYSGLVVYFWDPESQTIKCHAYFSENFREEQTLISSDKDNSEQMWESKWIFPNGNVGRFKCKVTYDEDTFTMVWSKISGSGPVDVGPFVNKRVKK